MEKDQILRLRKERDEKIIEKFCQKGTFMDEKANTIHGVCRPVSVSELLNFLHNHDAVEDTIKNI